MPRRPTPAQKAEAVIADALMGVLHSNPSTQARVILDRLNAAGLAVMPHDATPEMITAADQCVIQWRGKGLPDELWANSYAMMVAARPK